MDERGRRGLRKHDDRGRAYRGVLTGEPEGACFPVDSKGGNRVASLIAGVEETAGGIDGEAARIVAARPFFARERETSRGADGKPGDGVVQAVGGVDEPCIRGNAHLRSKV